MAVGRAVRWRVDEFDDPGLVDILGSCNISQPHKSISAPCGVRLSWCCTASRGAFLVHRRVGKADGHFVLVFEQFPCDESGAWSPVEYYPTLKRCVAKAASSDLAKSLRKLLEHEFTRSSFAEPLFKTEPATELDDIAIVRYEDQLNQVKRVRAECLEKNHAVQTVRLATYADYAGRMEHGLTRVNAGETDGGGSKDRPNDTGAAPASPSEDGHQPAQRATEPAKGKLMDEPATGPERADSDDLPPSRVKARAVYEWALNYIPTADKMPIRDLLPAIYEKLDVAITRQPPGAAEAEKLQELRDSLPDIPETFGKYLRDAGIRRYNAKGERIQRISHFNRRDQL